MEGDTLLCGRMLKHGMRTAHVLRNHTKTKEMTIDSFASDSTHDVLLVSFHGGLEEFKTFGVADALRLEHGVHEVLRLHRAGTHGLGATVVEETRVARLVGGYRTTKGAAARQLQSHLHPKVWMIAGAFDQVLAVAAELEHVQTNVAQQLREGGGSGGQLLAEVVIELPAQLQRFWERVGQEVGGRRAVLDRVVFAALARQHILDPAAHRHHHHGVAETVLAVEADSATAKGHHLHALVEPAVVAVSVQ
mmetsp:Transcript_42756/g.107910  ORF Transcript_42756/g.107910 Transcript_42756/m.107910 type:complete len:249 (+) Transcript_42756:377-1123(+)